MKRIVLAVMAVSVVAFAATQKYSTKDAEKMDGEYKKVNVAVPTNADAPDEEQTPVTLAMGGHENTALDQTYRFRVTGEEVWPFVDGEAYPYPNAVIWNINDDRVPQKIRECMKEASEELAGWLSDQEDPVNKAMALTVKYGGPRSFFLWTNDYLRGPAWQQSQYRRAQTWNWQNSFYKFESTVETNGDCKKPTKSQTFNTIFQDARTKAANAGQADAFLADYQTLGSPFVQ